MTSLAPGRINIFGLGVNKNLVWKYKGGTPKIWAPWQSNGPKKWLYEPISVSRVLNQISVFMVAEDGSMHQSNFDLVNLSDLEAWTNLGGKLISAPALAKRHAGIIHIFHIGSDHAIHHKSWDGVVYTPADGDEKLGGEFTHSPTAVSTGEDDVSVFGIGVDNGLNHYQWTSSSGWGPIEKLPGQWGKSLKAVSDQLGFIDVFGIDGDGNIIRNKSDWILQKIQVTFKSLDVISIAPGVIDIFCLSEKKRIFHRTMKDDKWLEWEDLMGQMVQPPTAVCHGPGALSVLCVAQGGIVFYKERDVNRHIWTEWIPIEGVITTRVG